ncbi:MAG: prepilin-type N-terminal cleavage/methylation domain-containing protein, partial [Gammaproteobacteria bacterium]
NRKLTSSLSRGFTLIEIMVVVVIIALLAGVSTPLIINKIHDANVASAKAEIKIYQGCIMEHIMKAPLPTEDEGLDVIVKDKCVQRIQKDPWGNEFVYIVEDEAEGLFDICSYGADGNEGGTGKAADICANGSGEDEE